MVQAARRLAPAFVIAAAAGTALGAPILYNSQSRTIMTEAELFMVGMEDSWVNAPDNSPFVTFVTSQVVDGPASALAISTQASFLGNTSIVASGSATGIVSGDGNAVANSMFDVVFEITQASLFSVSVSIAKASYLIEGPSLNKSTADGSFSEQLVLQPGIYRVAFDSPIQGVRNRPGASSWAFSLIEIPSPGSTALMGIAGYFAARRRR
ncbi:MAG: hypothetical protein EA380_06190 [Phycisphaeraceae bacterium]|nr:MAG: hypothetical protein EA380_06190 [Phycisphaeraceae bacterium]